MKKYANESNFKFPRSFISPKNIFLFLFCDFKHIISIFEQVIQMLVSEMHRFHTKLAKLNFCVLNFMPSPWPLELTLQFCPKLFSLQGRHT